MLPTMEAPLEIDDICKRIEAKPAELARLLGVSTAAVSQWRENGMPAARALDLERKVDGKVRASEIKTAPPRRVA